MKKITAIGSLLLIAYSSNAQGGGHFNEMVFRASSVIFVLLAILVFIITFLKRILEYRLKNKIIDKGIPENLASSLLQSETKNDENVNIKWFSLLAGAGAGLAIVNYTQPLGLHSLAIMCVSISISFLGYYFFQQRKRN